jgi:hypothetical protein
MRGVSLMIWLFMATKAARAQEKPPQPLPNVPVTAEAELKRNARLREFDRRRSLGIGRFITEAELDKAQHRQFSDVLAKLPGLVLFRPKGTGAGSKVFVVSSRGAATIMHESPIFGKNCPVAVWLDGVPVYRGLDRQVVKPAFGGGGGGVPLGGGPGEPPYDINSITTPHVAAVEFYAGPAIMPPELNVTQGTCGALVIWTK